MQKEQIEKNKEIYKGYKELYVGYKTLAERFSNQSDNPESKELTRIYNQIVMNISKILKNYEIILGGAYEQ